MRTVAVFPAREPARVITCRSSEMPISRPFHSPSRRWPGFQLHASGRVSGFAQEAAGPFSARPGAAAPRGGKPSCCIQPRSRSREITSVPYNQISRASTSRLEVRHCRDRRNSDSPEVFISVSREGRALPRDALPDTSTQGSRLSLDLGYSASLSKAAAQRPLVPSSTSSASSHTSRTLRPTERRAEWQVSWGFRGRSVDWPDAETCRNRSPKATSLRTS